MGKFNRSKAKTTARNEQIKKNRFEKEFEAIKSRSSLSYKSPYQVIAEDQEIKVLYHNKVISCLLLDEYHSYGNFFWCKPNGFLRWNLYQDGKKILEFDYNHRFFLEKENPAHLAKTIYHATAKNQMQMFSCISFVIYSCLTCVFYIKHNTWQIAQPNWGGVGLKFLSLKKNFIKVIVDRQRKGLSIETKKYYFLSSGGGNFERLDNPTSRMKFCANHRKPYYTGFGRLLSIGTELSFLFNKKHPY